jgi:hypothetical protein
VMPLGASLLGEWSLVVGFLDVNLNFPAD